MGFKLMSTIKVSRLFADSGCIAITAFISPYKADREMARELHQKSSLPFVEVFVDAPLEVVETRDPKGLYRKARKGGIQGPFVLTFNVSSEYSFKSYRIYWHKCSI